MNQRQRDDVVILAHIHEQHRLSLQSYGWPRMTEELQELGLRVSHWRVRRPDGQEWHQNHQNTEIQGDNGQQPQVQHCAQPAGSRFLSGWPQSKVGCRHKLHLDQ